MWVSKGGKNYFCAKHLPTAILKSQIWLRLAEAPTRSFLEGPGPGPAVQVGHQFGMFELALAAATTLQLAAFFGLPLVMLFYDIAFAFDCAWHALMVCQAAAAGVPAALISQMSDTLMADLVRVRIGAVGGAGFRPLGGVP